MRARRARNARVGTEGPLACATLRGFAIGNMGSIKEGGGINKTARREFLNTHKIGARRYDCHTCWAGPLRGRLLPRGLTSQATPAPLTFTHCDGSAVERVAQSVREIGSETEFLKPFAEN